MDITVMTYNIHHGKGSDKHTDLYRIADVIKKSKADIVGLNEVDRNFSLRSNYEDQIYWLAKQLNMYQGFSPSISLSSQKRSHVREYGNAILSRYPIITNNSYTFHLKPGLAEPRSLHEAFIQINGRQVRFYVSHLSLNSFLHRKQSNFILQKFNKSSYPTIIMGDWNMKPGSKKWCHITKSFQDVWELAGNGKGFTYPSQKPRLRLDYLFVSQEVEVVNVEVFNLLSIASDHLPLKATLSIY
ncbi:endonuclease/exonuclease/phosphatase family protein [Bacillus sp. APMAM]|nr:endonuclease/exonuclease/phosphatase family protein [Bacillus sp. APMAM]RTZ57360.1 endonuclease [Bacillus sp. SAJ1]